MPGIYWKFWVFWKWEKEKVTVIPPGKIGIVESIDGPAAAAAQDAGRRGGMQFISGCEKIFR